jgi:Reverse transcriptase (RNA-dependent DNA polymerase)
MQQSPDFVDPTEPSHVCLLSKALYGLKQSSRTWFYTLNSSLLSLGFVASHYDPSLFVLHSHDRIVIILVYVDDIIITGSHKGLISDIITDLQQKIIVKDLDDLHYFLGIEITHTPDELHLSQTKYIRDLLTQANMLQSKPYNSPMVVHISLSKFQGDPMDNPTQYRTIVGALQYATITRPDIAFAVNIGKFYKNSKNCPLIQVT